MIDFNYLFEYENYQDEESVQFSKFDGTREFDEPVNIPESLFNRMTLIGKAYGLHYLSLFESYEDYVLNMNQIIELVQEFSFVSKILNDKLINGYIEELIILLNESQSVSKCGFIKIIGM